jgi:hypothetical protein
MLHRFPALVASATVAAMLSLPAAAAGLQDFAGTYTLSASAAEKQAIDAAVDKAAEQFNVVIRFVARGRLAKAAKPSKRLLITVQGNDLGVQKDDLPMRTTHMDGTPLVFTHDGKSTRMTRQASGNAITETAKVEDGSRTIVYSLGDGGQTLTVSSTIESTQLKTPLRFSTTYHRSGK